MTAEELSRFRACAQAAEALRQPPSHVVFVLGCEMSLSQRLHFRRQARAEQGMQTRMNPRCWPANRSPEARQLNAFLAQAVAAVRQQFGGPLTYASGMWEQVDWGLFDIVAIDAYRDAGNNDSYRTNCVKYFAR